MTIASVPGRNMSFANMGWPPYSLRVQWKCETTARRLLAMPSHDEEEENRRKCQQTAICYDHLAIARGIWFMRRYISGSVALMFTNGLRVDYSHRAILCS
jgi:hypothetical protein